MQQKTIVALIASIAVVGVAVLGVTAGLGTVGAESPADAQYNRTVTVDATGDATAQPDQTVVRVGVTAEGDDPQQIRDQLSSDSEELRTALDALDVEYETNSYNIRETPRHAREEYDSDYIGHHSFEVTGDDPALAGEIIDAAAGVGAEIDDVELTLSEDTRDELRDEAIEDAMADARHQANTVAESSDLRVTGAVTIDATQSGYRPVEVGYSAAAEDGGAPRTTIDSGDVSVSYDVRVTYNATAA